MKDFSFHWNTYPSMNKMVTVLIVERALSFWKWGKSRYTYLISILSKLQQILFNKCKIVPFFRCLLFFKSLSTIYLFFLKCYQNQNLTSEESLFFSGDDIKLNVICFKIALDTTAWIFFLFFPAKIFFSFGAPTYFCLQFVKLWKTNLYGGLW